MGARPAVFLDRDGVINEAIERDGKRHSPMSSSEFAFIHGIEAAFDALQSLQIPIVVVTNQPEVARGRLNTDALTVMHQLISDRFEVTDIVFCPHDDADRCACRKPKPGMILSSCARHGLDPGRSVMVGDQRKDIEAGFAAGCRTILVNNPVLVAEYERPTLPSGIRPDRHGPSLVSAIPMIVELLGGSP